MTITIIFKTTVFESSSKTTKYVLNTFAFKIYGRFANHNLEKLCPWPLAATIPVLGLERCVLDPTSEL